MRRKKLLMAGTMVVLSAATLTGCAIPGLSKPKTAQDVVKAWQDKSSVNYAFDGNMTMGIKVEGSGLTLDIPVKLGLDGKMLDKATHMNMNVNLDAMGKKMDMSSDTYMDMAADTPIVYVNAKTDGEESGWTYSNIDTSDFDMSMISDEKMDLSLFENATMEYNKDTKTYIVKQDVKSILESDAFKDVKDKLEDLGKNASDTVKVDEIIDSFKDANLVYVFDSDFNLESLKTEDMKYSTTIKEGEQDMTLSFSIDMDFKFSDFGKIKADDVKVPADIKDSAVKAEDDSIIDIPSLGDDTESTDTESTDTESTDTESTDTSNSNSDVDKDIMNDIDYNGHMFALGAANSFDDIFGSDGWVMDSSQDGEYSFVVCTNDKYPGAELYVTPVKTKDDFKATIEDVKSTGVATFDLSCIGLDGKVNPTASVHGLSIGKSTVDDVITTLGDAPYSSIDDNNSGSLAYYGDDSSGEVSFYFVDGVIASIKLSE